MKEREKLAHEELDIMGWQDGDPECTHESARAFLEGFDLGFMKAREMMVAAITKEIGEAGLPTVGCDPKMGEKESK